MTFLENLAGIKFPDLSKFNYSMPVLKIGNAVCTAPVIQGGMGVGISLSGLASAVTSAGGLGVIAANAIGMIEDDYLQDGKQANIRALRNEIRRAKRLASGPVGVNIMVALNDYRDLLETAIEEKADVIILGAGLPIKDIPVTRIREAGLSIVPIVSSARAARLIFKSWLKKYNDIPDAVIVEGPQAGGHLGYKKDDIDNPDFSLEVTIPDVVSAMAEFEAACNRPVPVIAAGGIYSGDDIYRIMELGASGVQMGTRFVATDECDADIAFKRAYVDCSSPDDLEIIVSPVGMPGRAISNQFLQNVKSGMKQKIRCAWRCLEHCDIKSSLYCISTALNNARQGLLDMGFVFAGSNAHRVEKIVPVKVLIQSLAWEYEWTALKNLLNISIDYRGLVDKIRSIKNGLVFPVKQLDG
jgi:nitronate monooxygenase